MNTGQLNGFGLNASANGGSNATLQDGMASTTTLVALLISSVILTGGLENNPEAGGRNDFNLIGGTTTTSIVDAIMVRTANLQLGIHSSSQVEATMNYLPSLKGGVTSSNGVGGQVIANAMLRSDDTVGDNSQLSAGYLLSDGLTGGITSTAYTSGLLVGSVVLIADGLHSTSVLSEDLLITGNNLVGGLFSVGMLEGTYFINGFFSGGIVTNTEVGKEIDVEALLHGGIIQVNVADSPAMQLSPMLSDGVGSDMSFGSQSRISSFNNDGVATDGFLSAKYSMGARITGGVSSNVLIDSMSIRASQRLQGFTSSTGFVSGLRIMGADLDYGIEGTETLSGNQRISERLAGSLASTVTLEGEYRTNIRLSSGNTNTSFVAAQLMASVLLSRQYLVTLQSNCFMDGYLLCSPILSNGYSSNNFVGGDIVQGFKDPLLNAWALSIRSATPVLSLVTPVKDV